VGADDAVGKDASPLLEGAHRVTGLVPEEPRFVVDLEAQRAETRLHVGDFLRTVAPADQLRRHGSEHYGCAAAR
jgi:hypothetical protein